MYAILDCQIHKVRFNCAVGFGPITRITPHNNPIINELDMQHSNAPLGYSMMRYSFGGCPVNKECKMKDWKFIKEISEEEYHV